MVLFPDVLLSWFVVYRVVQKKTKTLYITRRLNSYCESDIKGRINRNRNTG